MNYKHLYYFWTVANSGSIVAAAERLHITPQTISGQIKLLEEQLGVALLEASGRNVVLTDAGRLARKYAEEIFALGNALSHELQHQQTRLEPFTVGISDAVPKRIAYRLLAPILKLQPAIKLIVKEGKLDDLAAALALQRLDILIADRALQNSLAIKAHSHKVGSSLISFFATCDIAAQHKNFPKSLHQASMLLPGQDASTRQRLDLWFEQHHIQPQIIGEFDDGALLKSFGQAGVGVFPAPSIISDDIMQQYQVQLIGELKDVQENYYVIYTDKRDNHPALLALMG